MFATLPPPDGFAGVGWILLAIAALCVAANQIDDFLDRRKSKPGNPPNEQLLQAHEQLREDFDRHVVECKQTYAGKEAIELLAENLCAFERDSKESRRNMHVEITALSNNVAALREATETTKQQVVRMEIKIDRLIERKH